MFRAKTIRILTILALAAAVYFCGRANDCEAGYYSSSGTFESATMDLGSANYGLDTLSWNATVPSQSELGIVGLWHFNGTVGGINNLAVITDSSTNKYNGAASNAGGTGMAYQAGLAALNQAINFDGTDDAVTVGDIGSGIKTVEFWIYSNVNGPVLELSGTASVSVAVNAISLTGFGTTTYVNGSAGSVLTLDQWNHVVVVDTTGVSASTVNFGKVGAGYRSGPLDEVAVYNRALTAAEISNHYNAGAGIELAPKALSLQVAARTADAGWVSTDYVGPDGTADTYFIQPAGLWHLNDGGSSAATADASGGGYNGTVTIGAGGTQTTVAGAWTNGAAGALANLGTQGLSFDGTDDYVNVGNVGAGIMTVAFWINDGNATDGILELNGAAAYLSIAASAVTSAGLTSPTIYVNGSSASAELSSGWNHVVVTTATGVSAPAVILGRGNTDYMSGKLDEVAVYDRALTAAEVKVLYNAGAGREGAVAVIPSGLNTPKKQYVRYKAFFGTADTANTPRLDDLTLDYSGYPALAALTSSKFDTGAANSFVKSIAWSEAGVTAGKDVKLQVSAAATSGGLTTFCGPRDGTDGSCTATTYFTDPTGTENIDDLQIPGRWFQYKGFLTSDGIGTATLDNLNVTYDSVSFQLTSTGGGSVNAGTAYQVAIKAMDTQATPAAVTGYNGSKILAFTGAGTIGANAPKISDDNICGDADDMSLGAAVINFASGVADPPGGGTDYYLCLYKAEAATISATASSGAVPTTTSLGVTVNALAASVLSFTQQPASTGNVDAAFTTQPILKVADTYGNPLSGVTIDLADVLASDDTTTGAGALTGTTSLATDSGGLATFTGIGYTGTDTIHIKAAVTSPVLSAASTTGITLGAGAVSAANSTVSASPATVAAGADSAITVTAKDQYGNVISGIAAANVVLAATGTSNTLTQPSAATDANGQTAGTLSSTKVEAKTVSVTINGTAITQTAAVTVDPAAASAFVVAGTASQQAGGANALTITAQDTYGNTVNIGTNNYTGDKSLTFSGASASPAPASKAPTVTDKTGAAVNFGTAATITFTNGVSSSGGSMVLYNATESQPRNITAAATGVTTPTPLSVTVTTGAATQLAFTTTSQSIEAGVASGAVTVQARDTYDNVDINNISSVPLVSTSSTMRFDTSASGAFDGTITAVTLVSGQKSFYFKDTTVSTAATITATLPSPAGVLQTSDTGTGDTPSSAGGFNAGTKTNTAVSGTGTSASVKLSRALHINEYTIGALSNIAVTASGVTTNSNGTWTVAFSNTPNLARIFKNDKFTDSASKAWKVLSVSDSADKIIVVDSEGNTPTVSAPATGSGTVGRWYASISAWETGRNADITANGRNAIERGLPYYDGAADTAGVIIGGWTTDATHYIEIYVPLSERHRGKWDTGKYRIAGWYGIGIQEEYVRIDGLQMEITGTGSIWPQGIAISSVNTTSSDIRISNNIIWGNYTTTNVGRGIVSSFGNTSNIKVWNNIIYGFNTGTGGDDYGIYLSLGTQYLYNNTVVDCDFGYSSSSGTTAMIAKNNIAQNCANGYSGTFAAGSDYNISDLASDAPSPSYRSNLATTVPFVDSTNKDFHLEFRDGTGNPAMNAGTNSVSEIGFTTDLDGDTRSGAWDIGADDVGATLVMTHSIGTASRDFSTLQGWEGARNGILTTRNVFKISGQSGAFSQNETITGTSGATGIYIEERDPPSASETYMTVGKLNATAFVAGDTLTGGTSGKTAVLSTILTTAGTIEKGEAYKDSTFTAGVTIDGSTTDASHYMWLTAEPGSRHTGVAGTGAKVEALSPDIRLSDNYTILENFEVKSTDSGFGRGVTFASGSITGGIARNNIIWKSTKTTGTGLDAASAVNYAYNNIVYGFAGSAINGTSNNILYNNTLYDNETGFSISSGTPTARNNISVSNTTADFSGTFDAASSNNISSDATAPAGTGSQTNVAASSVRFVSTASDFIDLHIMDGSAAKDAGADLSATFNGDIDGAALRPNGAAYDVGADEWFSSSPVYNTSGTFESATMDLGSAQDFGILSWTPSAQADKTAMRVAVAAKSADSGWAATDYVDLNGEGYPSGVTVEERLIRQDCAGYSNCYTSLAAWEDGEDGTGSRDLVAENKIAVAKIDGPWTAADTAGVIIGGWTTDATHYIRIYTTPEARHNGKWDNTKYRLDPPTALYVIDNFENYVRIDGLQVRLTYYTSGLPRAILTRLTIGVYISNNVVVGKSFSGTVIPTGVDASYGGEQYIWNNIVYGFNNNSSGYGIRTAGDGVNTSYVYNNTVYGNYNGIANDSAASTVARNNISYNNTDNYLPTFDPSSSKNNLSGPSQADAPGTSPVNAATVAFVDAANNDFRLASTDTSAQNAGADLSGDVFAVTTDILGRTRPTGAGAVDIGAYEVGANSGVIPSSLDNNRYLRYKVFMDTADTSNLTPQLDSLTIGYGSSGTQTETIIPAPAASLTVSGITDPVTAGTASNVTVTAKDQFGNTVTGYTGTVTFTSNDTQAVLPANYTFLAGDNGVKTFAGGVTLKTMGEKTVTAADTATGSINGTQSAITVNPDAAASFTLSAPADIMTGSEAAYAVTRYDAFNNLVTSGAQTVYLSSNSTGLNKQFRATPGGLGITSISIADTQSVAAFYYYDDKVGSWAVTASDASTPDGPTGIDDATDELTVMGIMSGTNVQPASLVVGAAGNVTVSFTLASDLPYNGKIAVTFPAGFDLGAVGAGDAFSFAHINGSLTIAKSGQTLTLTRSGGSDISAGTAITDLIIANVKNPAVSGLTGTYSIKTLTSAGVVIDQDPAVAADTIIPAALTSANVQPAQLSSSYFGSVTVSFTTVNPIPADGKILVTFGSGFAFNVGAATAATSGTMDGSLAVSITAQTVTVTRSGGISQAADAETITLSNIRNPQVSGSTGNYQIKTQNSADATIDQDLAVAADTITAGALNSADVQPASLAAGASGSVTVSLVTTNPIPADGKIVVGFPSTFDFNSGGTTTAASATMDGSYAVAISSQTVTVTRSLGTSQDAAAETITLSNIRNPQVSGPTSAGYTIETKDASDALIDSDTLVPADTFTAGALSVLSMTHASLTAGAVADTTVAFTTANPIPVNGDAQVTFPAGFDISGAAYSSGNAGSAATPAGQVLTINLGTQVAAGGSVDIVVSGIKNPVVTGSAGNYAIETQDVSDTAIDQGTAGPNTFTAGALSVLSMTHASLTAGAVADTTVAFTTANPIPVNGDAQVTFPAGFDISGAAYSSGNAGSAATPAGQVLTINLGTQVAAGGSVDIVVSGIKNPVVSGLTGSYAVETQDASDTLIDNGAAAPNTISASTLGGTNVQPATLEVSETGNVVVSFTTSNPLPADGKIKIIFPNSLGAGFNIAGVAANGSSSAAISGTEWSSVSGQTLTISRSGGLAISAGTVITDLIIANVKNPDIVGSTGTYTIRTTDSASVVIDEDTAVTADTTIAGALTAANVQPASLTAGNSGNVTVTFTLKHTLPADGKILVTFPPSFGLTSVQSTDASSAALGVLTAGVSGQVATITRNGAGGAISGGTVINDLVIGNVRNPITSGSGGTYSIVTANSSTLTIDQNMSVAADTFVAGVLSATNVQPVSLVAGTTGSAAVTFTTQVAIPADGYIEVTFGGGFDLSGVTGASSTSDINGGLTTSAVGQTVRITRGGTGSSVGAGATVNDLVIAGVKNPVVTGTTGVYSIATYYAAGGVIDDDVNVTADTITAASLGATNVQPASLVAGAVGNVTVTFTTANPIPFDGKILVTFPAGFDVTGVAVNGAASVLDINGTLAVSRNGQTLTIARSGGAAITSGSVINDLVIAGVKNPVVTGSTGTYQIKTTTLADVDIDLDTAVAADTITIGALTSTNVQPASLVAGAVGNVTVTFTTANPVPTGAKILVTFPSGFAFNNGGTTAATPTTMDGTLGVSISAQVMTLTRGGGTLQSPAVETITLSNVRNPQVSGSTGAYQLKTTTSADVDIDQYLNVAADTITVGALTSVSVTHGVTVATQPSATTINFTTANPIAAGGKVVVAFDPDFGISAAAFLSGNAGSTVSVASNVLTVTLGTAVTNGQAVSLIIGGIVNPSVPQTVDAYALTTKTDVDVNIDTGSATGNAITASFSFTAPTGSASWPVGKAQTVSWSTIGTVVNVNLSYAVETDSYLSWTTVVSNCSTAAGQTCASGSYSWTVPNIVPSPQTDRDILTELKVADADAGHPAASALTSAFTVKYHAITWRVIDANGNPVTGLNVTEASTTNPAKAAWNITDNIFSGNNTLRYYPDNNDSGKDLYTTLFDRIEAGATYSTSSSGWKADSDKMITLTIDTAATAALTYETQINAVYNATNDSIDINSWLTKKGVLVSDITTDLTAAISAYVYDANGTQLNAADLGIGKTVNAQGIFSGISYDPAAGLDPSLTYTIKVTVTYNSKPYTSVSGFVSPSIFAYEAKIGAIYNGVNDSIAANIWLERSGTTIMDPGDMIFKISDSAGTELSSQPFDGYDSTTDTVKDDKLISGVYTNIEYDPSAGLSSTQIYTLRADIVYRGKTYNAVGSFAKGELGTIASDISTGFAGQAVQAAAIRSEITGQTTTLQSSITGQTATLRSDITGQTTTLTGQIGAVGADVTALPTTVSTAVSTDMTAQLAKGVQAELLTRPAEVTTGATIPIRFRTASGLTPKITVYDAGNVVRVSGEIMKEISTTGIYEYKLTLNTAWGTGDFTVLVTESTKGSTDSLILHVGLGGLEEIYSKVSSGVSSAARSSNVSLDDIFAGVTTIQTSTTGLNYDIAALLTRLGKATDGAGAATVFGRIASIDTSVQNDEAVLTGIDEIKSYVDTLEGSLGSEADPMSVETIFGRLAELENMMKDLGPDSKELEGARTKANNLASLMEEIRADLANGNISGATAKLAALGQGLSSLNGDLNGLPRTAGTASVGKAFEDMKGLAAAGGLETLVPLLEEIKQSREAFNPENMTQMRNTVEELKSLMTEVRALLDQEVNKPVVHGWLEEGQE